MYSRTVVIDTDWGAISILVFCTPQTSKEELIQKARNELSKLMELPDSKFSIIGMEES